MSDFLADMDYFSTEAPLNPAQRVATGSAVLLSSMCVARRVWRRPRPHVGLEDGSGQKRISSRTTPRS